MRLTLVHAKLVTLELVRYPTFSVPTVVFPTLAFAFFVIPQADGDDANLLMASYAAFGFLAVVFFEFGVGIATERASPWDQYLRSLPLRAAVRFAGRILAALAFAGASAVCVVAVAVFTTSASLTAPRWAALAVALLVGAIPLGLLGIALGYAVSPKGALPIANVLYFALSYLGGLWTGPDGLPPIVERISVLLPTRQWSDVLDAAVGGAPLRATSALGLLSWTVAFAFAAGWAYRRAELQQYR